PDIEHIRNLIHFGRDLGDPDIKAELAQRSSNAVEKTYLVMGIDVDYRVIDRNLIVDLHPRREPRFRLGTKDIGALPLLDKGLYLDLPLKHGLHIRPDAVPPGFVRYDKTLGRVYLKDI